MENLRHKWRKTPAPARKVIALVVGIAFIIAGAIMLVLPGPGWATIFLGLAVLASEFERAETVRRGLINRVKDAAHKVGFGKKR